LNPYSTQILKMSKSEMLEFEIGLGVKFNLF
jgi:hypothetical protein